MKRFDYRIVLGIGLILLGLLYLLQEFGLIGEVGDLLWSAIFLVGGAIFLAYYVVQREHWWPIIPGAALIGIGLLIGLDVFFPKYGDAIGGFIFMASLGASFLFIYLRSNENWWALIPGGVLSTLAVVIGLDELNQPIDTGGIFMLGLGLTFLVVGSLKTPHGRMQWAYIPAGVLLVIGVIILAPEIPFINYLWPVAMILAGIVAILFSMRKR